MGMTELEREEREDEMNAQLCVIIDTLIAAKLLEVYWEYTLEALMMLYGLDKQHAEELKETIGSELGMYEKGELGAQA